MKRDTELSIECCILVYMYLQTIFCSRLQRETSGNMGFEKPLSSTRDVPALSTYISFGECLPEPGCSNRLIYGLCLLAHTCIQTSTVKQPIFLSS